ncbi:MAG: 6-pyruvoyl-tetrahydropterin synthase-related protein [Chloroflexi bacterium]|nr:6-pyruvoyl-tetrahydropterin synthase-related protein [Chloroflexota bacterium]
MTLRRLAIKLHPLPIRPLLSAAGWLALLLPVFAWAPLTYPGYFEFHSGFLPIFNLNDLVRTLAGPSLYSEQALAWAPMVGQSYDLWRGERVLPYLLALLPRALGATPAAAVKWIFGASLAGGAVGVYGWARRRLGAWPGLVAAFVYALWPIGLATIYVRGAFAEAVFLGLMPWVLWAAAAAAEGGRRWVALALALTLALVLWTQAGLALWLATLVLVYLALAQFRRLKSRLSVQSPPTETNVQSAQADFAGVAAVSTAGLLAWLGGLALGALGLLPVILRHGLGGGAWPVFTDHFVYPHQLLQAGWGTGPSVPGPYDTLTFQLGLVACGLGVLGIANRKSQIANGEATHHAIRNTQYVATVIVLSLSFLSSTLAAPLWRVLPFLARTLTYPWQLLLLAGPWLAWLAGLGARRLLDLVPIRIIAARAPMPATGGGRKYSRCLGAASAGYSDRLLVPRVRGASDAFSATLPLCAALLVLTLLGSYDSLQPKTTNVPVPAAPLAIFGDNEIALLSAVTAGPPGPGGRVTALVRWQALRPLDHDYTVFFHAIGPDGNRWGQQDTMPQGNQLPTGQWRPGQVVTDQYQVILAAGAPISNDYRYLLGLYLWQTGQRLATGTDDKVVLGP